MLCKNCETFPPPTSFLPRAQVLLSLIAIHSSRGVVRAPHSYWQSFMVKIISLDLFFLMLKSSTASEFRKGSFLLKLAAKSSSTYVWQQANKSHVLEKKKSERIGFIRNRQVLKESHQERTSASVVTDQIYHIDYHFRRREISSETMGHRAD